MIHEASITRWRGDIRSDSVDALVIEEPLEICVNDIPIAVTMRTPGMDEALAAGFLVSEGILRNRRELFDVLRCADPDHPDQRNSVNALIDPALMNRVSQTGRQRYATSSCGLCGRATIESVLVDLEPFAETPNVPAGLIRQLPERMRSAQSAFDRTGGLHAACLFDMEGSPLFIAEDVGRHNAVDKVVGRLLMSGEPLSNPRILMVSGRAGFEIVQKAAAARIPAVCSVSAPSSLAVDLALKVNLVLVGFIRGDSMNVYSCPDRVVG